MPDFVSSPANFCQLLLSFVGYFDVFPNIHYFYAITDYRANYVKRNIIMMYPHQSWYVGTSTLNVIVTRNKLYVETSPKSTQNPIISWGGLKPSETLRGRTSHHVAYWLGSSTLHYCDLTALGSGWSHRCHLRTVGVEGVTRSGYRGV